MALNFKTSGYGKPLNLKGGKGFHLTSTIIKGHHTYKVGKNLVRENKIVGKVSRGLKFVKAMNGLAVAHFVRNK